MKRVASNPKTPSSRRPRTGSWRGGPWLALFLVALALRVAYAWLATGPGSTPYSDAADYDTIAWNLANGDGFSLDAAAGPHPTAYRPPVVPWVTSLLYRAVGHRYDAALLLQCVIGALVPLLLARLGGTLLGSGVGWAAGWIAAFDPLLVFFSGYLMTETTFAAVLLLALSASVDWVKNPRASRALGVGLLWGLAALTRPTALPLPLLVAAWAWVPLGLALSAAGGARQVAMLLLGTALAVGPWTIRNALTFHAFVPITTGGGRAFLDSNNPILWNDPARRGGGISTYHLEPYAERFRGRSEVEADALAAKWGWEFLNEHRSEWPAMAAAKLARFWRLRSEAAGTGSWRDADSPLGSFVRLADPLLVWSLLTFPFAAWGAVRLLTGPRRWFLSLPLLVIVFFTALAVVYWGSLRTRMPIQPLIALCAAVGWDAVAKRVRARARGLRVVAREA
jgi:4-amino-4-deoxy-L-arabinose transferase-like glycosyltransferase